MGRRVSRPSRGLGLWGWGWRLCMLALIWLVGVAGWIVWVGDQRQTGVPPGREVGEVAGALLGRRCVAHL